MHLDQVPVRRRTHRQRGEELVGGLPAQRALLVSGVPPATGLRGGRVGFAHRGLLGGVLGRGLAPRSRIGASSGVGSVIAASPVSLSQAPGAASGGRTSVWAGRSATPTGQVTPLGPWLQ